MALTPSTMLPLGTPLPFGVISAQLASGAAQQVSGEPLDLDGLARGPVLVLFLCEHCPFVKHVEQELSRLQADVAGPPPRLRILAISSNSLQTHPQDGAEGLRAQAARHGWTFPYLLDGHQEIARAFRAACTPDPYLFSPADDGALRLVYRGQLDDSRPGQGRPADGKDLRAALAALAALEAGGTPAGEQRPAIGCNIKWHPGSEPEWAR